MNNNVYYMYEVYTYKYVYSVSIYMCYIYIVNSTVPAVTLPVAGYAHIHVWLYRAQDRSGGRRWNQNKPSAGGARHRGGWIRRSS